MTAHLRFLIADSEPEEARRKRQDSVGRTSGETFADLLAEIAPESVCDQIAPTDRDADTPGGTALADYDAVFVTGSPIHVYDHSAEVRRELDFMRAVFASGTPSFGSCAGLQVAVAAAGGKVGAMAHRREAGFARRIVPSDAGRTHPLLRGRPLAFDAPAIHTDEVTLLPAGATLLASNAHVAVQAAEVRSGDGVFWGVQYHPELTLFEVAQALRREATDLVKHGLARATADVESQAALVEELHDEPQRADLAWRLGLDQQVTDRSHRCLEIVNFIRYLVRPRAGGRGRG